MSSLAKIVGTAAALSVAVVYGGYVAGAAYEQRQLNRLGVAMVSQTINDLAVQVNRARKGDRLAVAECDCDHDEGERSFPIARFAVK